MSLVILLQTDEQPKRKEKNKNKKKRPKMMANVLETPVVRLEKKRKKK